jgi:hypothetical protein
VDAVALIMVAAAAEAGAPVVAVARKSRTSGATREAVAAALLRPALVPLCQAPPEPQEARLVSAVQMERCHLYVFPRLARHLHRHLCPCRRRAHHPCLVRDQRLARHPHLAQRRKLRLGHFRRQCLHRLRSVHLDIFVGVAQYKYVPLVHTAPPHL